MPPLIWVFLLLAQSLPSAGPPEDAIQWMKNGEFRRVIGKLLPLVAAQPNSLPAVYDLLASAQAASGDTAAAIRSLRAGLRQYPRSPLLNRSLGENLFRVQPKDPEAGEALAAAVNDSPRDVEALHFYGQWAYLNHREALAVECETKALALAGSNQLGRMQINLILGLSEDHLNHPEAAGAAFRRALEANRKLPVPDPMVTYQYMEFLDRNGREAETTQLALEVIQSSPDFGPARLKYARSLARDGKLQEAANEGETALANIGPDPEILREAHYFLAKTWLQLKQPQRAAPHRAWMAEHP